MSGVVRFLVLSLKWYCKLKKCNPVWPGLVLDCKRSSNDFIVYYLFLQMLAQMEVLAMHCCNEINSVVMLV